MAYNRRPRRQGVVYGPPRAEGGSENGALLGRFIGLGLIALTLGLLGVGVIAFLGDRTSPAATPGRSAAVAASISFLPPTPEPSVATTIPPSTPGPSAVASGTPGPSEPVPSEPAPSLTPPPVQEGPGFVTFGTTADEELRITDPRTTFTAQEQVVWSAYLTRPADSAELRIQIVKADPEATNGEREVANDAVSPIVEDGQIFQRRFRPRGLLDGPGFYTVRYLMGEEVLSQGSLQVIRE